MARALTEGLLGLRGLLLARLLGPDSYGAWTLFRIAGRYGLFGGLGVTRGLERELSQSRAAAGAAGPHDDLSARTALGFLLAVFSTLAAGALAVSFRVADPAFAMGLRAFAASALTEMLILYTLTTIRARGELRRFAKLEIMNAAVQLTCVGAGALARGLEGALAGFVLASLFNAAVAARRVSLRPALARDRLGRLLRIGFPQALSVLLGMTLVTADKLAVAAFGGTSLLGYYAFATSIAGLAGSAALIVRTVVFPEVYGQAVTRGQAAALRTHLDRTVLPFTRLYPPLLGFLALGIGPLTALALSQYLPAVPAARLYIFTGFTAGLITLSALGVVAADRQRLLPLVTGAGLLANAGLSVLALTAGAGIEGAAAGAILSQAGCAASVLWLALRAARSPRPTTEALRAILPLFWCAAAVYGLGELLPGNGARDALLAAGAYALLLLPWLPEMRAHARGLLAEPEAAPAVPAVPLPGEDLGTSVDVD
ncbi:MAG TPA: oligosaccharide flippase family protein [Gemmatimonadota bacterium]